MAFELTLLHSAENQATQSTTLRFENKPTHPDEIRSKLTEEGTLTPAQLEFCIDLIGRTDSPEKLTIPHEDLYAPSLVGLQAPAPQKSATRHPSRPSTPVPPKAATSESASLSQASELLTDINDIEVELEPAPASDDVPSAPVASTESAGELLPSRKAPGIYKTAKRVAKEDTGATCTVKGKVPEFLLGFTAGLGTSTLGLVFNVEFELMPAPSGGTELHVVPALGPHDKKALCLLPVGVVAKLGKVLISAGRALKKVFTKEGRANLLPDIKEFVQSAMLPRALLKLAAISTGVLVGGLVVMACFSSPVGMTAFLAAVITISCVGVGAGVLARTVQHGVLGEGDGPLEKIRRGFYNDLTSPRAAATAGELFGTVAGVALVAGAMEAGVHSLSHHGGEHGAGGGHSPDPGHLADAGHGAADHGAGTLHGSGAEHASPAPAGAGAEHAGAEHPLPAERAGHSPGAVAIEGVHQAQFTQEVAETLLAVEELEEAVHDLDEIESKAALKVIEEDQ